jgi:hypothetical protein
MRDKKMQEAILSATKESVVASAIATQKGFVCPDCQQHVYLRRRESWSDHFCHKPNSNCSTRLVFSPETEAHKIGKNLIALKMTELLKNPDLEFVVEKQIKKRRGGYRIIDVAVIQEGAVILAAECQLSPIIVEGKNGLKERSEDYKKEGIQPIWWFGENSLTKTVEAWCRNFFGAGSWVEITSTTVKLKGYIPDQMLDTNLSDITVQTGRKLNQLFLNKYAMLFECIPLTVIREHVENAIANQLDEGHFALAANMCQALGDYVQNREKLKITTSEKDYVRFELMILSILVETEEPLDTAEISRRIINEFHLKESDYHPVWGFDFNADISGSDSLTVGWKWLSLVKQVLSKLFECKIISMDGDWTDFAPYYLTPTGYIRYNELKPTIDQLPKA